MEELSTMISGERPQAAKKASKRTKRNIEEAGVIIAEFCQEFHAARVEPTTAEMSALWDRCSTFKSRHISAALGEQLSLQSGTDWQPRLRALCLLEQCFEEDSGAPQMVAIKAFEDNEEVLKYLASNVPACADKAKKILKLCAAPPTLRPKAPPPSLPVAPMAEERLAKHREAMIVVKKPSTRNSRNPEKQALLSDVGEEPGKPPKEESETTASSGRSPTTSSGDDDAAKQAREENKDQPFDPNLPVLAAPPACQRGDPADFVAEPFLSSEDVAPL